MFGHMTPQQLIALYEAKICPCCGFQLWLEPWSGNGRFQSDEICPCCHIQFGYTDFTGVDDLIQRTRLERSKIELLAQAGALEPLMKGRRNALWAVRRPRRFGLFEAAESQENRPQLSALPPVDTLRFDYATKQLSVNDHPLKYLRAWLKTRKVVTTNDLFSLRHHERAAVAGLVLCRQKPYTAKGIMFMTVEDEVGVANLIVMPDVQDKYGLLLRQVGIILAFGQVERSRTQRPSETPVVHLKVEAIEKLKTLVLTDRPRAEFNRTYARASIMEAMAKDIVSFARNRSVAGQPSVQVS